MELLDVSMAQVTSAIARISEITCPPYQTVSDQKSNFEVLGSVIVIGDDMRWFGFSCVWLGALSNEAKGPDGAHGWSPLDAAQRARPGLMWWYPIWGFDWARWACWNWQNTGTFLPPVWSWLICLSKLSIMHLLVSGWNEDFECSFAWSLRCWPHCQWLVEVQMVMWYISM